MHGHDEVASCGNYGLWGSHGAIRRIGVPPTNPEQPLLGPYPHPCQGGARVIASCTHR